MRRVVELTMRRAALIVLLGATLAALVFGVRSFNERHASTAPATRAAPIDSANFDSGAPSTFSAPATPTLVGVVQSASGERIANAQIDIHDGPKSIATIRTDSRGVFAVVAPTQPLSLRAKADGFGIAVVQTVAPAFDIVIMLYPSNAVSGQVMLEDSLQPVRHVHVTAELHSPTAGSATDSIQEVTDEQGRFRFPELGAGAWQLSVADQSVWGMAQEPVVVTLGEAPSNVVIFVRRAGAVRGRFVVGEQKPCTTGRIQLISTSALAHAATHDGAIDPNTAAKYPILTKDVEAGLIRFDAVPLGSYRVAPVCDQHRFASGPTTLDVRDDDSGDLVWTFASGARITVKTVDELGKPISGALIALLPIDADFPAGERLLGQRSGPTDAQGTARFSGLRAGRYRVSARFAALNSDANASQDVYLSAGVESAVTLNLPAASVLRIHAHDPSGAPVSRILFFAINDAGTRYEANFKGDGRFTIGPMPHGRYRIYAYDNKNAKIPLNNGRSITARDGEANELDFVYEQPTGSLEGRIMDGGGTPLPETLVRAVSVTLDDNDERFAGIQAARQGAQELMTDRDGRFRIEGLNPRASYDLYIDHRSGFQDVRHDVRPGSFAEIVLPLAATITGAARDIDGKPLARFDLLIETENGTSRSQSFANADGRFKIESVYPGRLHLALFDASGQSAAEVSTHIQPGQSLDLGVLTPHPIGGEPH